METGKDVEGLVGEENEYGQNILYEIIKDQIRTSF